MFTRLASLLFAALLLMGCGSSGSDPTAVPDGWTAADTRWWRPGTDTTRAFRSLTDLQAMGLAEQSRAMISQQGISRQQLNRAVKRALLPMYRHNPEVVDSLFAAYAVPVLQDADLSGTPAAINKRVRGPLKQEAYQALKRHFRDPVEVQSDAPPVAYPDSLRQPSTSGRVRLQVYLNKEGVPQAVRVLQGVHPTLNRIALRSAALRRWQPAFVLNNGDWAPIPSWVHFTLNFQAPSTS
ncbi:TonB family protein [Salisaeta longa]|uniref:TonB family protein n=1 Tax=Salisaeta longa TaxID=503170 RepID=UPI0003B75CCC|nr:TonB family protein [Salisaeta longa]